MKLKRKKGMAKKEMKVIRQSPPGDRDDRARLLAGRDPRQIHFDFYLEMIASLDRRPCQRQALLREYEELGSSEDLRRDRESTTYGEISYI